MGQGSTSSTIGRICIRSAALLQVLRLTANVFSHIPPVQLERRLALNRWVVMSIGIAGASSTTSLWVVAIETLHLIARFCAAQSNSISHPYNSHSISVLSRLSRRYTQLDSLFYAVQAAVFAVCIARIHKRARFEIRAFSAAVARFYPSAVSRVVPSPTLSSRPSLQAHFQAIIGWFATPWWNVEHIKDITYATPEEILASGGPKIIPRLQLDILRKKNSHHNRPILIYIHGGAWLFGDKRLRTLPICHYFASTENWVVLNINYRMAPAFRLEDMLVDIKRAIRWARSNNHVHGGDSRFIAISGGSAGGHLCSLAALTANWPQFQPGFEDTDTTVQACLPWYPAVGHVYASAAWKRWFLEAIVQMKPRESLVRYDMGTDEWCDPMAVIHRMSTQERIARVPPFFVIEGTFDNIVEPRLVRAFVSELCKETKLPVGYLEVPGAHHAFDLSFSPKLIYALWAAGNAMETLYNTWLALNGSNQTILGTATFPNSAQTEEQIVVTD
ncbi:TLE member 5 [Physocladia obscura]|uniref:TLE member 5 n=1 Tax=Physocladia obscura TaxID=109957 RepID=A0AAD5T282_9FUNG|nr:TLE member 5 [Physocladia obscura]